MNGKSNTIKRGTVEGTLGTAITRRRCFVGCVCLALTAAAASFLGQSSTGAEQHAQITPVRLPDCQEAHTTAGEQSEFVSSRRWHSAYPMLRRLPEVETESSLMNSTSAGQASASSVAESSAALMESTAELVKSSAALAESNSLLMKQDPSATSPKSQSAAVDPRLGPVVSSSVYAGSSAEPVASATVRTNSSVSNAVAVEPGNPASVYARSRPELAALTPTHEESSPSTAEPASSNDGNLDHAPPVIPDYPHFAKVGTFVTETQFVSSRRTQSGESIEAEVEEGEGTVADPSDGLPQPQDGQEGMQPFAPIEEIQPFGTITDDDYAIRPRLGFDCAADYPCGVRGWAGARMIPWEMFAQGEYIGPARLPHVPIYRLRVDDQLDLVFRLTRKKWSRPYRFDVGDEILVESLVAEELNRQVTVGPDGMITLRQIGQVPAANRTINELRNDLEERYKKFVKNPTITVTPIAIGRAAQHGRSPLWGWRPIAAGARCTRRYDPASRA